MDKRGAKSDEAYVREVLGDMAKVTISWSSMTRRITRGGEPEAKTAKIDRQWIEEATKWIGGLDRIHKARKIFRV